MVLILEKALHHFVTSIHNVSTDGNSYFAYSRWILIFSLKKMLYWTYFTFGTWLSVEAAIKSTCYTYETDSVYKQRMSTRVHSTVQDYNMRCSSNFFLSCCIEYMFTFRKDFVDYNKINHNSNLSMAVQSIAYSFRIPQFVHYTLILLFLCKNFLQ